MENFENEFEKLGYKKIRDDGKFLIYRNQNTYFGKKRNLIISKKLLTYYKIYDIIYID